MDTSQSWTTINVSSWQIIYFVGGLQLSKAAKTLVHLYFYLPEMNDKNLKFDKNN